MCIDKAVMRTNIELKNSANAIWFSAEAALIHFSHCVKDGVFKAHIEEICYADKHGNAVILNSEPPHTKETVRFEFLAEEIETSPHFAALARQALAHNFGGQAI